MADRIDVYSAGSAPQADVHPMAEASVRGEEPKEGGRFISVRWHGRAWRSPFRRSDCRARALLQC